MLVYSDLGMDSLASVQVRALQESLRDLEPHPLCVRRRVHTLESFHRLVCRQSTVVGARHDTQCWLPYEALRPRHDSSVWYLTEEY